MYLCTKFKIFRMYGEKDLSGATFHCRFELVSGAGDMDLLVTSVSSDGTLIDADWDVRGNATTEGGKLKIQVVAVLGDDIWQSRPATIPLACVHRSSQFRYVLS